MEKKFQKDGFLHLSNFLDKRLIKQVQQDAERIFEIQMQHYAYSKSNSFEVNLFKFFNEHLEVFANCGKHIQHLPSLHRLGLDKKIFNVLKELGLGFPCICTRPVLFFNHKKLAKDSVYHTIPPHQDWSSMQGSENSIVVWVPLVDVNNSLGALKVAPGSHQKGLQATEEFHSFGLVRDDYEFIDVEAKLGDALFFSSYLVHQSGNNVEKNKIRWSCHFRYNDLKDKDFINRGYPHPYIYRVKECRLAN